ncbi:MAG: hypothetical protein EZS28_040121 [Streblomastix strix]|uniref:Uncharacterized protein n=1 Tax=Streblomastix strix TaxID=222440 RepID=A0A5J4U263_9EUKA|nr:MAG: hypothetical protein EZS28_040121 [Streblomastix strix]
MPRLIRNPLKVAEIKQLISTKQMMLGLFTLQFAWELLVVKGYQRANILDAGVVSRWQGMKADHLNCGQKKRYCCWIGFTKELTENNTQVDHRFKVKLIRQEEIIYREIQKK